MRPPLHALIAGALLLAPVSALAALRPRPAGSTRAQTYDTERRVDLNSLNMWVTGFGHLAFDVATGQAGLIFPKGTSSTVVFASGLWLGCRVNGDVRIAVAEYASEFGPGAMVGGAFDDPLRPEYRVYKVAAPSGDPQDTRHELRLGEGVRFAPGIYVVRLEQSGRTALGKLAILR